MPRVPGIIGASVVLTFAGVVAHPSAQMFLSTGRDTLRALPGVEVVVEGLDPDVERRGLTRAAIHGDMVQRLRAAGIAVYRSQKENPSEAKPYLYVHVNVVPIERTGLAAVAVQMHLRQTLRSLVTGSNIVDAVTWDAHNVFALPSANLGATRPEILGFVDRFVRDWSTVH